MKALPGNHIGPPKPSPNRNYLDSNAEYEPSYKPRHRGTKRNLAETALKSGTPIVVATTILSRFIRKP